MSLFSSLSDQQSSYADEFRVMESAKRCRTAKAFREKGFKGFAASASNVLPNASGLHRSPSSRMSRYKAASAGVKRRI
jgi:hypothetical protein